VRRRDRLRGPPAPPRAALRRRAVAGLDGRAHGSRGYGRGVALSSSSTVAEARAQFRDSGSWRRDGSVSLAHDRLEAIDWLRDAEPNGSAEGVAFTSQGYAEERAELLAFIEANDPTASTRGPSATRMRPGRKFRG
jgi:hypothetical protein